MGKWISGGDGLRDKRRRTIDEDDGGSHRGSTRLLKGRVRIREVRMQGGRDSGELDKSR